MSMLSDRGIRTAIYTKLIKIDPYDPECLQPCSYDCHLDDLLLVQERPSGFKFTKYVLEKNEFILGVLKENITLSSSIAAQISGKSSLGRQGLACHITAGFVDAGWSGKLTLELKNLGNKSIILTPGMEIAQIVFYQLSSPALRPYGHPDLKSKYQGATQPEGAK